MTCPDVHTFSDNHVSPRGTASARLPQARSIGSGASGGGADVKWSLKEFRGLCLCDKLPADLLTVSLNVLLGFAATGTTSQLGYTKLRSEG